MNDADKDEPAFPGGVNTNYTNLGEGEPTQPGMTLRDYFAARALQGDWAASEGGVSLASDDDFARAAKYYYRMADAMLAARNELTNPKDE